MYAHGGQVDAHGGVAAPAASDIAGGRRPAARGLLILLGLSLLTLAAYLPALRNGFVGFDDPQYVVANPHVRTGLTAAGLRWAATASVGDHWHPLTLISLMTDAQLFGLNPKGYHLTNLVLHLASVLLLFTVLRRMTGAPGRSAAVAALFAVHPVHVESVAWIAERKDVLCGLLWMVSLLAWVRYVRAPSVARYLLVAAAFAADLLAKSMAVTLPVVLLLLDLWPLGRWPSGGWPRGRAERAAAMRLVAEKVPLAALAVVSGLIALHLGAPEIASGNDAPFALHVSNALTSYVAYLGKMIYPAHLAVFYPFKVVPAARGVAAAIFLAAITVLAVRYVRSAPYLLVGWLWYLLTILPVIGFVQMGWQGMADRYTYLPSIGISIAVVWGLADLLERLRRRTTADAAERAAPAARSVEIAAPAARSVESAAPAWTAATACVTVAILLVLTAMTRRQVGTWADTLTLFSHALEVEPSYLAHTNVAEELRTRGDTAGALAHFRAALALAPRSPQAHTALGNALRVAGRPAEALAPLRAAVALDPADERARLTLAMALDDLGQRDAAIAELRRAAAAHPRSLDAHRGLAVLLARSGDPRGAAAERGTADALLRGAAGPR